MGTPSPCPSGACLRTILLDWATGPPLSCSLDLGLAVLLEPVSTAYFLLDKTRDLCHKSPERLCLARDRILCAFLLSLFHLTCYKKSKCFLQLNGPCTVTILSLSPLYHVICTSVSRNALHPLPAEQRGQEERSREWKRQVSRCHPPDCGMCAHEAPTDTCDPVT